MSLGAGRCAVLVACVGGLACTTGCGLRSDADGSDTVTLPTTGDTSTVLPPREGDCATPFEMIPAASQTLVGTVPGRGETVGWCGGAGGENVHSYQHTVKGDMTLSVRDTTEFTPVIRVVEQGCDGDHEVYCGPVAPGAQMHFFTKKNVPYAVIVDSESGADAGLRYEIDVDFAQPSMAQCGDYSDVFEQYDVSAYYTWSATVDGGQGVSDGPCDSAGREHFFQVNTHRPGVLRARATGWGGVAPVMSLRKSCGGATEFTCVDVASKGELVFDVVDPRAYVLVVDNNGLRAGGYDLEVWLD